MDARLFKDAVTLDSLDGGRVTVRRKSSPVLRLVRIDLYKLLHRRATGVILVVMLLFLLLITWLDLSTFSGTVSSQLQMDGGQWDTLIQISRPYLFPVSLLTASAMVLVALPLPLGILISLLIGTDYRSGVIRMLLTRGSSRTQYLLAKLITIGIVLVVLVPFFVGIEVLVLYLSMVLFFPMVPLVVPPFSWSWVGTTLLYLLLPIAGIGVYCLIAFTLTLLSRTSAVGIAGIFFLWISEFLLNGQLPPTIRSIASLSNQLDHDTTLAKLLQAFPTDAGASLLNGCLPLLVDSRQLMPYQNSSGDQSWSVLTLNPAPFALSLADGQLLGLSSLSVALLLLLAYSVVCIVLSWLTIVLRDVTN